MGVKCSERGRSWREKELLRVGGARHAADGSPHVKKRTFLSVTRPHGSVFPTEALNEIRLRSRARTVFFEDAYEESFPKTPEARSRWGQEHICVLNGVGREASR